MRDYVSTSTITDIDEPYSYDDTEVKLYFKTMPNEKDNKLFFGVELEVEYQKNLYGIRNFYRYELNNSFLNSEQKKNLTEFYRIADICQNALKDEAILKWDTTIHCGFEINTAPATLNYHREVLWGNFFEVSKDLIEGRKNCGMHVHINRAPISELAQAKMVYFIHNKYNQRFISRIAGRSVGPDVSWRKTKYIKTGSTASEILEDCYFKRDAISISESTDGDTFEVRIFASVPTKQGVIQALEFLASLIEYCEQSSSLDENMDYRHFINWFIEEKKHIPYPTFAINLRRIRSLRNPFIRFATRKAA